MTEVIAKPFEDRPDYWEGRYMSTLHTLKTLLEIKVNLDLNELSDEDKQKHLEAIALEATKYEWEKNAK